MPQCSQTVGKQCFNNFGLCQVVKNIKTCEYMNMHGQQTRQQLTNENTLYSPKIIKKNLAYIEITKMCSIII